MTETTIEAGAVIAQYRNWLAETQYQLAVATARADQAENELAALRAAQPAD